MGLTTELGAAAGMSIACWSRSSFAGTWQGGGAFVLTGIGLMMVGARVFVISDKKLTMLSRYAPGGSGVSSLLRVHLPPCLLAMSAFVIACKRRNLCQAVYSYAPRSMNLCIA